MKTWNLQCFHSYSILTVRSKPSGESKSNVAYCSAHQTADEDAGGGRLHLSRHGRGHPILEGE